jgi:DNA-binding MarR family transcriptional regulator
MIDRAGRDVNLRPRLGRHKMARSTADSAESEPFKLTTSASHLLHRAEQLAADRFVQLVGDSITLRQFAVLVATSEQPGLSQSDLVRETGIDRSTLADMMKGMEKRGWVVRTKAPNDARAYSVVLGQAGGTMLSGMMQHARAADAAILDLLPRTKRRSLLNILTKLSALAEEAAVKAERDAKKQAKREARERAAEEKPKPRGRKQRT